MRDPSQNADKRHYVRYALGAVGQPAARRHPYHRPQDEAERARRHGDPLGDGDRHLRDVVLLVAVDHPQIGCGGQILAAYAGSVREPVAAFVRGLGPRQVEPRRAGLLAWPPFRPAGATLGPRRQRRLAGLVVPGRWAGRVPRVPRQQMLQPGQPIGQILVGLHQLRGPGGQRGDLRVLRRDPRILGRHPLRLLADERDQLIAGHLLRRRHPVITAGPNRRGSTDTPTSHQSHEQHQSHPATWEPTFITLRAGAECLPRVVSVDGGGFGHYLSTTLRNEMRPWLMGDSTDHST